MFDKRLALLIMLIFSMGCISTPVGDVADLAQPSQTTASPATPSPSTPTPTTTQPPTTLPPTTPVPTTQMPPLPIPTTASPTTPAPTVTLPPTTTTQPPTTTTSTSTTTTSTTTSTTTTTLAPSGSQMILNAPRSTPTPPFYAPGSNLEPYLVDVEGYDKSIDTFFTEIYDISAKYTKIPIKVGKLENVKVELYILSSPEEAIAWMRTKEFANDTKSRNWNSATFMGYPASFKNITFSISDRHSEEVFLRVAVGNIGVFSKFTQSIPKSVPLTPMEEAQAMVEEVSAQVILALEGG